MCCLSLTTGMHPPLRLAGRTLLGRYRYGLVELSGMPGAAVVAPAGLVPVEHTPVAAVHGGRSVPGELAFLVEAPGRCRPQCHFSRHRHRYRVLASGYAAAGVVPIVSFTGAGGDREAHAACHEQRRQPGHDGLDDCVGVGGSRGLRRRSSTGMVLATDGFALTRPDWPAAGGRCPADRQCRTTGREIGSSGGSQTRVDQRASSCPSMLVAAASTLSTRSLAKEIPPLPRQSGEA